MSPVWHLVQKWSGHELQTLLSSFTRHEQTYMFNRSQSVAVLAQAICGSKRGLVRWVKLKLLLS